MKSETLVRWTTAQSAELFGMRTWGGDYFHIDPSGQIMVRLRNGAKEDIVEIGLKDVASGLAERGMDMPVLLRFPDILDRTISRLNESFAGAIRASGYQGAYRGVFPIKVNQQAQVVEEIATFGRRYHHGLEAGSKAELLIAMAYLQDPEALVVCNGYKDSEFVDLALHATRLGIQVMVVLETLNELDLVIARSQAMGVRPRIGLRLKLAASIDGKWNESSGDRSVFGLTMADTVRIADRLRAHEMLDCLMMVHYHLGSQIPNIRSIRTAVTEAMRVYIDLVREGAAMGFFDVGGGLAVDYDGSRTNYPSSCNYDVQEYCADIVETVMTLCDEAQLPHPTIVSESGRFLVSYSSVLLFNILDVSRRDEDISDIVIDDTTSHSIKEMAEILESLSGKNLPECFNDAIYWRDEIRNAYIHGTISLRDRANGERLFWHVVTRIAREAPNLRYVPEHLKDLQDSLADVYYGNFSVFQSLPDAWAIGQLFPIMPIHRLDEEPTRRATIADITCDCDGKIDQFIDLHDVKKTLPVHEMRTGQDYILGVFLVGAYQETLGDLHNLFGDTNIVSVRAGKDGKVDFTHETHGDSVSDVLSYVEYDPKDLVSLVRQRAEQAVRDGRIAPAERREIMEAFHAGIQGYTYFEPN